MVMDNTDKSRALAAELAATVAPEAICAVRLFQKEFGRMPDAREQKLIVDAIVDFHFEQERD
jgi:hypothetical protein